MAQNDDNAFLDEFLTSSEAPPTDDSSVAASPIAASNKAGLDDEFDSFLNEYKDPLTGDDLPEYANGFSPSSAKAQSPLSYEDRLKLSFSNKKGSLDYLKTKFEDAVLGEDNLIKVKKDGQWFLADPANDPWETTKNLLKGAGKLVTGQKSKITSDEMEAGFDVLVDPLKEYGIAGASIGAGIATGGASLGLQAIASGAAGAAAGGLTTSLGRAVGTYEATPAEQVQDIAFEGLLNLGGTYLAAGIKPGAKVVAQGVRSLGKSLSKVGEPSKDIIANTIGKIAGFTRGQLDEVASNAGNVAAKLSKYSGQNGDEIVAGLQSEKVEKMALIAKNAQSALSNAYDDMAEQISKSVPSSFSVSPKEIVKPILEDAFENGFIKFSFEDGVLSGAAAREVWESGVPGKIIVNNRANALKFINKELGQALDLPKETHSKLANFLNDVIVQSSGIKQQSGKEGFKQLMNLKKQLSNMTYDLAQDELPDIANRFRQYGAQIADSVVSKMSEQAPTAAKMYGELQTDYSVMKRSIEPVASAFRRFNKTGDANILNTQVQQIISGRAAGSIKKAAFEESVELLEKFGGKSVSRGWKEVYQDIKVLDAAQGFAPWIKGNLYSGFGGGVAAVSLGLKGAPLLALGSPRALLYGAQGFQALNRAAKQSVRAAASSFGQAGKNASAEALKNLSPSTLQAVNKVGFQSLKFLQGVGKRGSQVLMDDPTMLDSFTKSLLQVPQIKDTIQQDLMGAAVQEGMKYDE